MKIEQVAVQLYTLRDHLKTEDDYLQSLKKVAEIGYQSVQISGPRPVSESVIAEMCQETGLVINSSHEDSLLILDDPKAVVENLNNLGCDYTAYPYPREIDMGSKESVDGLIEKLDAAGKVLAENGKVLTYHNHGAEFRKLDGQTVLERIYQKTDSVYLQGEIDTYWIQQGGGNPVEWVKLLRNRLPLLHLKDYKIKEDNSATFCEIGNGTLPFKEIIAEAELSGCKWFIVEQDVCPGDPFDSLEISFKYIKDNLVG